ncbi:MAG: sulfatase-like hydrolase/transferase [Caulobacterales bacterium]|uniref:sulfatase-like hydrolase/transferase n=1 Tax=Glycocaulis sp. TaxID=1969725 RepID=UPI003FA19228
MSTGLTSRWLATLFLGLALAAPAAADDRPNILLIILDDIGMTDLGAYGSEIATPNMDALAERGAQFTNFHVAPTCAPTRAMLMTGTDSHRTGIPTLEHMVIPEYQGQFGHEGELNTAVATIAEHLAAAGYQSFIAGKWHLGRSETALPAARGFDRSFILDSSGADNWEYQPYLPHYTRAEWWEDSTPVESLPEDFYSSQFLTDRLLNYIDEGDTGRPFLAVLSLQANHIPLQAPREFVERYDGVYDAGWDALREARLQAAIERGLVEPGTELAPPPPGLRDWDSLSDNERAFVIASREVAAGMLEAADHHVGRLLDSLDAQGRLENTIVIVLSDNGPEYNRPTDNWAFDLWLAMQGYSRDVETLGEEGTYAFIGPEWALASASPFSLFKFHAGEGGVRVPLLISGPGVEARGLVSGFSFVTDIAPTLLELAGAQPLEGREPITGRSLLPVLSGNVQGVYGDDEAIGLEMSGMSALWRGDWKIARSMAPHGDGRWRLFNLADDPGEARDLSEAEPEIFASMLEAYAAYEARVGVIPVPDDFNAAERIAALGWQAFLRQNRPVFIGAGLLLLALLAGGVLLLANRRR